MGIMDFINYGRLSDIEDKVDEDKLQKKLQKKTIMLRLSKIERRLDELMILVKNMKKR